jgi:hypothetical protein
MSAETKQAEYLYTLHEWDCSWLPDSWTEHPIIKKTPKFVFVAWLGRKDDIRKLNRQELEETGETFHRFRETYYTEAGKNEFEHRCESLHNEIKVPDCLKRFGLDNSATAEDVKRKYRKLAQQHHPDTGGNHQDFIKLQAEYEAAMAQVSA